jgi:hypothetical protein
MKRITSIIVLTLCLISSCKTDRQILTGSICGNVYAYDIYGNRLSNTVTISIPELNISTTANSFGFYKLENIPDGTYTILYTSETTEEYLKRGVQVFGGSNSAYIGISYISEKATGSVSNLRIEPGAFMEFIKGESNNTSLPVGIYISSESDVSKNNYDFYGSCDQWGSGFSLTIDELELEYPSTVQTVYIVAYLTSDKYRDWNCDEYNLNCVDPACSDTPSNIISYNLY